MKLRRTLLITPAQDLTILEKNARSRADVAWIELEDGIHPSYKAKARHVAAEALKSINWNGKDKIARVNPMTSPEGAEDIDALVRAGVDAVLLSKVQTAAEVQEASRLIDRIREANASEVRLWCMIESAKGLACVEAIASATTRVSALFFGPGDFSADIGVRNMRSGQTSIAPGLEDIRLELIYARSRVVVAARAAGLSCFTSAFNTRRDFDAIYRQAIGSFQFGFDGLSIISPLHVEAVHRAYAPSDDDIQWASRTIGAAANADEQERTVEVVDDSAVDGPHYRHARQILDRAAAIKEANW
jgi:citrate lyase subunit beta/citryl-CoA lyase